MRLFDRRQIESAAKASPVRHEVVEALADPFVTTLEGFLRRLFMGAPNTAIDNGLVVERFDLARAVLMHPQSDQPLIAEGAQVQPWSNSAARAFLSAALPHSGPPEESEYVFRFVDSSLYVPGNLVLSGPLFVTGDVRVDGVIQGHDHRDLMVMGDVYCHALACMRGYVLIDGSLSASELVMLDDIADVQVAGNLLTPGVLTSESGGSGITVGGDDSALRIDADDPHAATLFGDDIVGDEDASLSGHLMRALLSGASVWRKVPASDS